MKEFTLDFDGYFIDMNDLPTYGGIYLVYKGSYNPQTDKVDLDELIYIGEAENIKKRHTDGHEHQDDFESEVENLENGRVIYATAEIASETDRERVENALIYHHAPEYNIDGANSFNHPTTRVISVGAIEFLDDDFTQDRVE